MFCCTKFLFFLITFTNESALQFREYSFIYVMFAAPRTNAISEDLNYSRFCFFHETLICLYLEPLVNNFLNLLFWTIHKSPVIMCR